jgi:hypothetical protein
MAKNIANVIIDDCIECGFCTPFGENTEHEKVFEDGKQIGFKLPWYCDKTKQIIAWQNHTIHNNEQDLHIPVPDSCPYIASNTK